MKKNTSRLTQLITSFFSFGLLMLVFFTPAINSVVVGGSEKLNTTGQSLPLSIVTTTNNIPTAVGVNVTGRVRNTAGRPIYKAQVVMTDSSGQSQYALTNPFGYFRFFDVPTGATYTFGVKSRGYQSTTVTLLVTQEVTDLEIAVQETN